MKTVLVIGATGRSGRHVVEGLLERGAEVRALVRHPLVADLPPEVSIIEGSIEDPVALEEAATGADAAFLLWPGFDDAAVDAVVGTIAAHVDHIVYLSAARLQHGQSGVMDGIYARIEAAIAATGTRWTFLRAGGFAANTLGWAGQIRSGDVVRVPFPDAARPLLHERDIAEAAVAALLDPDLAGRAFELTGDAALTQRRQVALIGAALGRELRVEEQPPEEARAELAPMGEEFADTALAHWADLVEEPEEVRGGVRELLGRSPRPFSEWAREHAGDFARLGTREVAEAYADALAGGEMATAWGLLADDVVRVAPLESGGREEPVEGVAAIAENAARQTADATIDRVEVSRPLVDDGRFALRFTFDETERATGRRRATVKLSLCTVEAGRIAREEVFYYLKPGSGGSRES